MITLKLLDRRRRFVLLVAVMPVWALARPVLADAIAVPNASFESPEAPMVSPFAIPAFVAPDDDDWIQTPVPGWWPLTPTEWDQSAGVFFNVPGPNNITNADGDQLAFMFATPDLGIVQDLAATYEVGRAYAVTVGLRGGSGGMPIDSPIEVSLYYRDGGNNIVPIASTEFLNDNTGSPTELLDVRAITPLVRADDPWAGEPIGIRILSTVGLDEPELQNGTWGIDNVRLEDAGIPIPAVSIWGIAVMFLSLVVIGELVLGKRKRLAASPAR